MRMDSPLDNMPGAGDDRVVLGSLVALWLQLFYCAVPFWRFSEYYEYGWYVPPIAAFFFYRRWRSRDPAVRRAVACGWVMAAAVVIFPLLLGIRALAGFDSTWRPPLLLQTMLVVMLSHWLLVLRGGWRLSLGMAPVTIFALTAIPYPYNFEQALIAHLTDGVVRASAALFNVLGRPVAMVGTKLASLGTEVEVTDGCSGIRSLQSLLMAGLFFGELFFLRSRQRMALLAFTGVVVVGVNIGRVMTLARIRFDRGEHAFEAAHDQVGQIAFLVSAAFLFVAARSLLETQDGRKQLVRSTQEKVT
jgi:exosortase